jgi:pimeloyl-ACP methyl ester carboxylesterase
LTTVKAFTEGITKGGTYWRRYGGVADCPLVMVVGYGGQMSTWTDQFVHRLAEKTDVLIFDHHGSGKSKAVPEDANLSLADFAAHLTEVLDDLGIEKVNLFGYSMGGCISLEFLRAHPHRVNKLLLCATTSGGRYFHNSTPEVAERVRNPRGNTYEEMYFDFLSISMSAEAIEKYRSTLEVICAATCNPITPQHVLTMKLKAFRNFDAADLISTIKCPTMIFHGKNDDLMPLENGLELSRNIPGAQSVFFENCGHYPHIEYQDQTVDATLKFFVHA